MIAVQVPVSETDELIALFADIGEPPELAESRPFDGETVVQGILVLTTLSTSVFKAWLRARVERAKSTVVSVNGIQLSGMTAAEAERILRLIDELND